MTPKIKEGTKVHYTPSHGAKENGIVKSMEGENAFVVYKCAGDWGNYKNYTGASTCLKNLTYGWVDDKGELLKEFCDHYYVPTNAKWQSITQRRCQWCGDITD